MPPPVSAAPDEDAAPPSLAEVLVDMLEEGKRSYPRDPPPPPRWEPTVEPAGDLPLKASRVAGCLGRAILLVVLFVALLIVLALAALMS